MTWYDDTTSLAGLLELVVQNYESDREEYWSEDSNDALLLELLDHVAQALVEASGDLLERSASLEGIPFDWSMIRRLADHPELKAQVLEKVQIDLGYDFVGRIDESAIRCLELTQTVLAESPPPSVAKYVRRLSRCYVNGFLPECVILCRAVVENSIRARYDRASIPLPASDKGSAPMRGQIEFAKRAKWITDDAASGGSNRLAKRQHSSTQRPRSNERRSWHYSSHDATTARTRRLRWSRRRVGQRSNVSGEAVGRVGLLGRSWTGFVT